MGARAEDMAALGRMATSVVTKSTNLAKNTVTFATPRLQTFLRYAKVELVPPSPAEMPAVQKGFNDLLNSAKTGKWKQLTMRQAWLNTLVGIEIACWFFVGECIGKGSIVGYQVPGTTHFDAEV